MALSAAESKPIRLRRTSSWTTRRSLFATGAAAYRFPSRSNLLFALLERVARRPGHRVDFDALRAIGDVWDGSLIEDSPSDFAQGVVRGAVARLRGLLEEHGMGGLAVRIQTGTYRNGGYVLLDVPGAPDLDR